MRNTGSGYHRGGYGLTQDHEKAVELYLRAGELGCATAYHNLAEAYLDGEGVEEDEEKAKYYWELAAMRGVASSRHNLGVYEENAGNMNRAMKHYNMAAAGAGYYESFMAIRHSYLGGHFTKDYFDMVSRLYKKAKGEMTSDQREAAEATRAARAAAALYGEASAK